MTRKRIEAHTVITQIVGDRYVKPQSPLFSILNSGTCDILIDGMRRLPGEEFGVNADAIVAEFLLKNIPVINTTQYHVVFDTQGITNPDFTAQLIETFLKVV